MSKADRAKKRQQRKRYAKPSMPRMIGANDNIEAANDNRPELPELSREPGVKETPGQRIFRQMLRRAIDERPRPTRSYDPSRLTPEQERQLRRADEQLKSLDPRKQAAAKDTITAIAEAVAKRVEGHNREAASQEWRNLEALRGNEVLEAGRNEPPGRLNVPGRDGLRNLTRSYVDRASGEMMPPAIDPEGTLYAAALLYRRDYEKIDPERELTPPQLDPAKVNIAHGGENWDDKRLEIQRRIFRIHLMIAGVEPGRDGRGAMPILPKGHPAMRAIHALVEIAGKGTSLSEMTRSGSVKARIRDDLIFALEACEIVYGFA